MKIRLQFKLQDFWIGVFWRSRSIWPVGDYRLTSIWICLIPCFPINIELRKELKPQGLSRFDSTRAIEAENDFIKELREKTARLEQIAKERGLQ